MKKLITLFCLVCCIGLSGCDNSTELELKRSIKQDQHRHELVMADKAAAAAAASDFRRQTREAESKRKFYQFLNGFLVTAGAVIAFYFLVVLLQKSTVVISDKVTEYRIHKANVTAETQRHNYEVERRFQFDTQQMALTLLLENIDKFSTEERTRVLDKFLGSDEDPLLIEVA
jgi:hypothetical protein